MQVFWTTMSGWKISSSLLLVQVRIPTVLHIEEPRPVVMIDFAQCRLRREDEDDELWKQAKWSEDEEGAVGYVLKKFFWMGLQTELQAHGPCWRQLIFQTDIHSIYTCSPDNSVQRLEWYKKLHWTSNSSSLPQRHCDLWQCRCFRSSTGHNNIAKVGPTNLAIKSPLDASMVPTWKMPLTWSLHARETRSLQDPNHLRQGPHTPYYQSRSGVAATVPTTN